MDIRSRIIAAYKRKEGGYIKLGKRFGVAERTVRSLVKLLKETGDVTKRPRGGGQAHKISDAELQSLAALVAEKPDRSRQELVEEWQNRTGTQLSSSAMQRALARAGLSFKKRLLLRKNANSHALNKNESSS